MRYVLTLGVILCSVSLAHPPQFISVNVDGYTYQCHGNNGTGTDPNCVKVLSDWCSQNTSHSSSSCFDKASQSCKGSLSGYSKCVVDTADYCYQNTSNSSSVCFDKALGSCKGEREALLELLESVKTRARK